MDFTEWTSQPSFDLIKVDQMDCPTENMTIDRVLAWNELVHILRPDREAWSPLAQHAALSSPLGSLSHLSKDQGLHSALAGALGK